MGGLSTYCKKEMLNHALGITTATKTAAVYLALSTADFTVDGSGAAEPSDTYVRQSISFSPSADGVLTGLSVNAFAEAGASWGTLTHWAIYSAETSGNILAWGALDSSQAIGAGNTPSITATDVVITITTTEISNYLADELLDYMFSDATFVMPTAIYAGLATAALTADTTGTNVTEEAGTGYGRKTYRGSANWGTTSTGTITNSAADLAFDAATAANWGTVEAVFLVDAASDGNILFFDNGVSQAVGDGDQIKSTTGNFTITLN